MKRVGTFFLTFVCLVAIGQQNKTAVAEPSNEKEITLEDIYTNNRFVPAGGKQHNLDAFGHTYIDLRKSDKYPNMSNVKDVWIVDPVKDKEQKLISSEQLVNLATKRPLMVEEITLTADGNAAILNTRSSRSGVTGFETWYLDITSGTLEMVAIKGDTRGIRLAAISPDKKKIAFCKNSNIFVKDIGTDNVVQLTHDGSKEIVNGASAWPFASVLSVRGIKWSPNSKYIAFTKFNNEGVRELILINNTDSLYPFTKSKPYVKPGETIPSTTVGIVNVETKSINFADLPGMPNANYITYFDWKPDSDQLMVQQLSRKQNNAKFFSVNPDGKSTLVYEDKDKAFLTASDIYWLDNGKNFLWVSEKSGWRHIYKVSGDGKQEVNLINKPFDIESIVGIHPKKNLVYFIASPETSIYRYLYAVKMDGNAAPYRVTPDAFVGVNKYQFSADGEYAYHNYSTINTPPVVNLVSLPNHEIVKEIGTNKRLKAELVKIDAQPAKFIKIDIGDGIQLDAWQILPPNFDAKKKYPVIFHVYSMPGNQVAKDNWLSNNYMWYQMMAQKGYIIMNIDGRGTPALYGREWRKVIYGRHGILPSDDIAKATKKLIADYSYIDKDNIGIFGWSGGGMISLLQILRYPDIYKVAIPGAFLSSSRLYHAAFTERFMGLPQENGEAYDTTAALSYVKNLKGKLLLMHGTGDDNVNYQSTEVLINKLIEAGKTFYVVPYPNRAHGLQEGYHQFKTYTTFFDDNLKPVR